MQLSKTESLRQARQHIAEGRVSSAMSIYQKIVEEDPTDLAAVSMLGDLYVKADRIPDAVVHFLRIADTYLQSGSAISATYVLKKVLKIDPANPVALMNVGELDLQAKEMERAHGNFIEAGAAFWHKGDAAAAIRMNKRALDAMPESRHARAALALIEREVAQSKKLPEPKREIKREVISDLPEIIISIADGSDAVCAPALYDGQLLSDSSDAVDIESQPGFLPIRDEDALVEQIATAEFLVGCGQTERAIRMLREMLQDKPDDIQIREKLKDIYLRSEMIDRASDECVNIAAVLMAQGESNRAADYVTRARLLNSSVEPASPLAALEMSGVKEVKEAQEGDGEWTRELKQPTTVM